jgi:hypothetical protein
MIIGKIIERKDGGADIEVNLSLQELELIVTSFLTGALENVIKKGDKNERKASKKTSKVLRSKSATRLLQNKSLKKG